MAVKIRLMRVGKKKQPSYRVVVTDARSPRDGRFIEVLGQYAPRAEPSVVSIDSDRALHWLKVGAQPTEQVGKLLEITGVWDAYKADVGKDAASKPKVKTPKAEEGRRGSPRPQRRPPAAEAARPRKRPPRSPQPTTARGRGSVRVSDEQSTTTSSKTTTTSRTTTISTRTRSRAEGNRVKGARAQTVIELVARQLVDDPDGVFVDATERSDNVAILIHTSPGDLGRIIGKRGRVIQAAAPGRAGRGCDRGCAGHGRGRGVAPTSGAMTSEPVLLEVGRVGRAHGLRGEVHIVAVSNVEGRFAPGLAAVRGRRASSSCETARRRASVTSCTSRASTIATRPRRCARRPSRAEAARRCRPRASCSCTTSSARRCATAPARASGASTRCRRTPRTSCSCSTAARSIPMRVRGRPRTRRRRGRPARRPAGSLMRIDVFTIFPDYLAGPLAVSLVGRARDAGRARRARARSAAVHDRRAPLGRRRAVRRRRGHGDDAGAAVRRGRSGATARGRCCCCRRAGRASIRPVRASSRPATGSRCCAAGTKASTSGSPTTAATASCRSATTCSPGGEAAALVVIEAVTRLRAGRDGQRGVVGRGVVRADGRGASSTRSTRGPRGSATGTCRRCCGRATTRRVARWRRAQSLRRTRARRPDLLSGPLERRGGALLGEFPPEDGPR